jgi:DNA replication and repair protein RecF
METMRPKDLIGNIPTIVLSPDYKEITAGSPENRRRFLNTAISQLSNNYLSYLLSYQRVLKQRNNLLSKLAKDYSKDYKELNIWTEKLIEYGSKIIARRANFIKELEPFFIKNYQTVSNGKETVGINYKPFGFDDLHYIDLDETTIVKRLSDQRDKYKTLELKRQTTLWGPQKDELELYINGSLVRETASQGQHKSVLISLKLAEFDYMKEALNETPIVLLDDIFSELDVKRTELVIKTILDNVAQAFITVTEVDKLKNIMKPSQECYYFHVQDGQVTLEEED